MFSCCFKNKKRLENLDDADEFTLENKILKCKIIDIYDGDTLTFIFKFGDNFYKNRLRLSGIDCPEIRTKNKLEKEAGYKAKKYLQNLVLGKIVWIKFDKNDKYGRSMGWIYLDEKMKTENINSQMIVSGLAYEYNGEKKQKFDEWYKE